MKKAEIVGVRMKILNTLRKKGWGLRPDGNLFHVKLNRSSNPAEWGTTYETSFSALKVTILVDRAFGRNQKKFIVYTSAYYKDVIFFDDGSVKIGSVIL